MYRSCYYRSCCSSYFSYVFREYKKRQACTFIKKGLWHRCFPVNCATFLKNLFLQNTSGWLLQTFVTGRKVFRNLSDIVDFFKIIYGKLISSRTLSHLTLLKQSCEKCPVKNVPTNEASNTSYLSVCFSWFLFTLQICSFAVYGFYYKVNIKRLLSF